MSRPTWVIFYAIFIILIGGCSLMGKVGDTQIDKITNFQKSVFDDINFESEVVINQSDNDPNDDITLSKDTISAERLDSINKKLSSFLGDSLIMGDDNKVDMKATLAQTTKMSDYRIAWTKRFGWIGIFFSLGFIAAGALMWSKNKYTIPIVLTLLSSSMALGLFQYFIFKADRDSGSLINIGGKFEVLWSIALDAILLIVFMVVDKSYFGEERYSEDFN